MTMTNALVFAQNLNTFASSGSTYQSSGGTMSFTLGQLIDDENNSSNLNIAQGVQQVYSNETSLHTENIESQIFIATYPNPVVNHFYIKVKDVNLNTYSYKLFDLNGRLLSAAELRTNETKVSSNSLQQAVYILNIFKDQSLVETVKILKT